MKEKLCIFAGTTEGRALAKALCGAYSLTVCVATDYGKELLDGIVGIDVRVGRMDAAKMAAFIRESGFSRVVDATHPYALEVSQNIISACESTGTPLLRVLRSTCDAPGAVYVGTAHEAAAFLAGKDGNILLTTGAKELYAFKGLDMSRVWARVLPAAESLSACEAAGIAASHIIAMQGPFSQELNAATLRHIGARWLVTKSSGAAGGFDGKIAAAENTGAVPVVIGRPPENAGVSFDQALKALLPASRRVTLIGIGPGGAGALTAEARQAMENCDAVIGARPVLEAVGNDKPQFQAFLPKDVVAVLESHSFRDPAVVLRGDVGFFSGAEKLREALSDYDVTLIPGIASPVYFAARLGIPWDDIRLISLHGRDAGLIRAVDENLRVAALTGGENTVAAICKRLCEYGFSALPVTVGERLSYPDERITRALAGELRERDFDSLSVMLIENAGARRRTRHGIPDGEFIRGGVPMTKSEVRSVCLSKLAPDAGSVIWDVGAGTGSVSVECALAAWDGRVYAVERSPEARSLIRQNAVKFRAENITVVEGAAPEALEALPAPTHVFIGGASGDIKAVMEAVLRKNPAARIVAAAVTLETQAELISCARDLNFEYTEAVAVSVARSKKAGLHTLMSAQNTVTVFTVQGAGADG